MCTRLPREIKFKIFLRTRVAFRFDIYEYTMYEIQTKFHTLDFNKFITIRDNINYRYVPTLFFLYYIIEFIRFEPVRWILRFVRIKNLNLDLARTSRVIYILIASFQFLYTTERHFLCNNVTYSRRTLARLIEIYCPSLMEKLSAFRIKRIIIV